MDELDRPAYGTTEFYKIQFADILADIQYDSPETSDNLITGLKLALSEWREYHANQVIEIDRISQNLDTKGFQQLESFDN